MADVEGTPLWSMTAPSGPDCAPLGQDVTADVAVVGGGFGGLSAALHAAKAGHDTVLLESGAIGSGASGRTNGQVIPVLKKESPAALIKRYGEERGPAVVRLIRDSAETLFSLVRDYAIDCEANQQGWLQPAVSPKQLDRVTRCAEAWAEQGARVDILDRGETADALGSTFYRGGWRARDGGSVQPLGLSRGLARAAIDEGARIYEHTPADAVRQSPSGWRIAVGDHSVTARCVLLATAADTAGLAPDLSRQVVPACFYQVATRPLENAAALLPGCGAMSDAQGDLYFFRKDAAGRLVTGGTFVVSRNWQRRLPAQIQRRLDHVFPDLGDWQAETRWSGRVAMTDDFFPRLAQLGDDFYGWIGCNGRGVALSVSMGRLLAELAAGAEHASLSLPLERPAAFPLRELAPVGVGAALISMRASDQVNRFQGRRDDPGEA